MNDFCVFDAHCDTLNKIYYNRKSLSKNDYSVDIERMGKYKCYIQVFAVFYENETALPYDETVNIINNYKHELNKNIGLQHINSISDFRNKNGVFSILAVEGGEALEGKIENLYQFYKMGVRILTLTWNRKNELGCGSWYENEGLTRFGKKIVCEMNKIGMIIDVSHLNEKGFYDVLEATSKPVIASHSNSSAICGHKRNLTDEQFKALIKNRGVAGINFYPEFLTNNKTATCDNIIRHIYHFLELGGENSIGFGSDFDGVNSLPLKIKGIENYSLINELLRKNFKQEIVDKILYKNFQRVVEDNLNF